MRPHLFPIVQTVVVEQNLAGIETHEDYSALRSASLDAEGALLAKMQETLQKNWGSFRHSMRDLVMEFFKAETREADLNHVKWNVFGRPAGTYLMETDHPTVAACWAHPHPMVKGTQPPFVAHNIFPAL